MHEYVGKDLEAMTFARNYHRWILSEFLPYLGNSVAEVGAGAGSFSKLLLETPIGRLTAFEPSQNMYPILAETLRHDRRVETINGFFCGADGGARYDSIVYVNVLEHVEDHEGELSRAREGLGPNGHLLIFVPALPWLYSPFDKVIGHFRRYRKHDLVELAERTGFATVSARYFDVAGILPWYVKFVLLKNMMSGASVSLYDKLVVPGMRLVEGIVPPPIGKNLLMVARAK
jgi:SAM-dependent methyltransferase